MSDRPYPMTKAEYEMLNGHIGCSCHINPPCWYCVGMPDEDEDEEARALEAAEERQTDIWDAVVSIAGGKS